MRFVLVCWCLSVCLSLFDVLGRSVCELFVMMHVGLSAWYCSCAVCDLVRGVVCVVVCVSVIACVCFAY